MLSGNSFASGLLNPFLCDIAQSNHADRLPNTQTNARSDTSVKTLDTILLVDVLEGPAHVHVLGAVGILRLTLHLDSDNLDGLVPSRETTTNSRGSDLLNHTHLLTVLLASELADTVLSDTRETEARTPVGDLTDSDSINTTVDAANALASVYIHEGRHGAWWLHPRRRHLVLCDFHRLHACAEAHGRVGLSETTDHATADAGDETVGASCASIVLGLRCDKEEDGTLGRGFDPCPGDETLVDCGGSVSVADSLLVDCTERVATRWSTCAQRVSSLTTENTTTTPNASYRASHTVTAVCGHGSLSDFEGLRTTLA